MKKIFKTLFLVSCVFAFTNVYGADAIEYDDFRLYPIKDKKMINNILSFYEENNKTVFKIVENKNRQNNETINNIEEEVYEEEENNAEISYEYDNYEYQPYEETANFDSNYTDLAEYALQFVGNPYVYGGTSLTEGADCSGFVMKLYEQYGVQLPRTATAQATVGYSVSIENAQPGDIISYGYDGVVGHSAIYIGNEMIVHASTPQGGIKTDSMYIMPIISIRRIG